MERPATYHPITKSFHWLIVAMVSAEFAIGWLMPEIRRSTSPAELVSFHMSFGILILGVMLIRLILRFFHTAPSPEPGMPWWQELAANWIHILLYASVIALPLTGWLLASAHGWALNIFGYFSVPALVSASTRMEQLADSAHVATAAIVAILIGLHVLAALYHHYILRDGVLRRMLP